MTTPRKDFIKNIAGTVIASVIVTIFTLYASGIVTQKQDERKIIESKLDKLEFDKHERWDDKRFDELRKQNDETVTEIKDDIKWLRNEVVDAIKKNKKD